MIYKVPTSNRQVSLDVRVHTDEPRDLVFIGFDPLHDNTEYFHRDRRVDGEDHLIFHLPISPRRLHILIFDRAVPRKKSPGTYRISSLKVIPLSTRRGELNRQDQVNIRFIERFARRAGYTGKGMTRNLSTGLVIDYLPVIKSKNGIVNPTPARIHKFKNYIQVSQKHFRKMTIPQRIAILLHEYSHNFKNSNQDSEKEADFYAMKMYMKLGYPDVEAVHAFGRIFGDNDINVDRIASVFYQLKQEGHGARKPIYNHDILETQYIKDA